MSKKIGILIVLNLAYRKALAQSVAPRVLISAVTECYHKVAVKQKASAFPRFTIFFANVS